MRSFGLLVVVLGLAWAREAHALKPAKHASITRTSCRAAGLPADFCERAALENYNTDAHEWDDPTAHAQIPAGLGTCEGADLALARAWSLGGELRTALDALATVDAATALGRAAHQLQDGCAHEGMPNDQHAWYSLSDFCDGTRSSPDIRDEAIACAERETDELMRLVASAVAARGAAGTLAANSCPMPDSSGEGGGAMRGPCEDNVLPAPWDVCQFLDEAGVWDGRDARWDHRRMQPALRAAFAGALHGGAPAPAPICAGDAGALAPAAPDADVDTSQGAPSCVRAHLLCLGKVDAVDYFADDEPDAPPAAGCEAIPGAAETGRAGAGGPLLVTATLLLGRRRRRAARR